MKIIINGCSHSTGDYFYKHKKLLLAKGFGVPALRFTWWNYLQKELGIREENIYQLFYFLINHLPNNISSPYSVLGSEVEVGFYNTLKEKFVEYITEDDKNAIEKYIFTDSFLISLANDGKGNDTIFLETFDVLRKIKKNKIQLDYLIIQWSSPVRKLVSDGKAYLYANPHENYNYGLNFEPAGSLLTLNYMIILQEYLKEQNIKYIFLNYFPLDEEVKNSFLYNQLDFSKIVTATDSDHPIFSGWLSYILSNKLNSDDYGNSNIDGNKFISKRIEDKMKKEYNDHANSILL